MPTAPGRVSTVATPGGPRTGSPRHRRSKDARTPGAVQTVLRGAGARILVLAMSSALGIVSTRLIIDHFGRGSYAQYGLLIGLASLLPFTDLGMSAALMNAVAAADDARTDPTFRRILITSVRVLFCSAAFLVVVAILLEAAGAWHGLLGQALLPHSGPTAATLCLAVIGLSLVVGFGQRILTGIGKNHLNILIFGAQTPVVFVTIVVMIKLGIPGGGYLAVVAYTVTMLLSLLICWFAARKVTPAVGHAIKDAVRIRTVRGGPVLGTAWPTLVQLIALPIAMQTDRIVLSHVSSTDSVAQYNLASQMFSPVGTVAATASIALWPIFARTRSKGIPDTESPIRLAVGFGAVAAVICALIGLASPWLAARASGSQIHLSATLIAAFAAFMVCQCVKSPLGMYMTDPQGLRYQARMIVLFLVPVNLGLSIYLAKLLGAPGPVIGSTIAVLLWQVVANSLYVRRAHRRRALASDSRPSTAPA